MLLTMPLTFQALTQRYLRDHLQSRASYKYYCRLSEQYFVDWTTHRTKREIRQWHAAQLATPAHANKGLGFLKALYNWAINEELWDHDNPASGIRRHRTFDRERTMTEREVTRFMQATPQMFWKFRALALVLLTTGARLSEARTMEWTHLDLSAGSWTKPTTKNGRPHRVPVPRQTCAVLAQLLREGRYVFPGHYEHPLSCDAAEKQWGQLRRTETKPGEKWPALAMPDVRLHDFRRTIASRLLDQGAPILLIKSVLNHYQSDITGIYARSSFDRQADALQQHADALWALAGPATRQSLLPYFEGVDIALSHVHVPITHPHPIKETPSCAS